jgi:hypothetical protein
MRPGMRARLIMVVAALGVITPGVAMGQGTGTTEVPADGSKAEPEDKPVEPGKPPGTSPGGDGASGDGSADDKTAPDATTPKPDSASDDFNLEDFEVDEGPAPEEAMTPNFEQAQPPGIERIEHHYHRWIWHNLTAVRLNPLGLANRFRTGYEMQLSDRNEPIFEESHASIQLDTEITPAFGYVGTRLEVQPVKILNFWGSYGVVGTFGGFSNTRSFPSAGADHDDDLLDDTRDSDDYSAAGQKAVASGLFQVGIGGLVMRSNVKAQWMKFNLQGADTVFYDAALDVLVPNDGWVITNDADLLFITDWDLIMGVRHTFTHALYREEHLLGADNLNTPHQRVGPAIIYTLFDDEERGSAWDKAQIVFLAQWWAKHRYRTSQSPGLPNITIAFVQSGDFMVSDKE